MWKHSFSYLGTYDLEIGENFGKNPPGVVVL